MTILDTNKILVANWFEKEHIEEFLQSKISDERYQEIIDIWNKRGIHDYVSELMRDWLIDNEL